MAVTRDFIMSDICDEQLPEAIVISWVLPGLCEDASWLTTGAGFLLLVSRGIVSPGVVQRPSFSPFS